MSILVAVLLPLSCRKKPEELPPGPAAQSSSLAPSTSVSSQSSSSPGAWLTRTEKRDRLTPITHELCEAAAKRINALNKRPETDPSREVLTLISVCLRMGNAAWYKCILEATTPEAASDCSHHLLRPRQELMGPD